MIFWLLGTVLFAKPLAECRDLPTLYTKEYKSPLSKVYNPMLYAMRNISWDDLAKAGLHTDSTMEIGSDWLYWSHVSSLSFVQFIYPYLWPDAEVIHMGNHYVLETDTGRWKGVMNGKGLYLTKINAEREALPEFWPDNQAGCTIHMDSVQLPFIRVSSTNGVALSFQHTKPTVSIAFLKDKEEPLLFRKRPLGVWTSLQTTKIPTFALALGEEPLSLVDMDILNLPEGTSLDEVRTLDKKLHLSPGTQVAAFGDDIVASIPLQGWFGCPLPRWQISWGLRSGEKISKHRRKIIQDERIWYAHAQKGRVVLSSNQELLDDILTNTGTEWFSNPKRGQEEHVLARLNIPRSLYMFVGPLEHVELSLSAKESSRVFEFFPFTQSKARPHQLFLTYFATLQTWDKKKRRSIPRDVEETLKKMASYTHLGEEIPSEQSNVWTEETRVFMEDSVQQIWFYDPLTGIGQCDNEMTEGCESVK